MAIACLLAWRLLTALSVPGLAEHAVARQLEGYRLRDISVGYSGVRPLVDMMLILFMAISVSQRIRSAFGRWEDVPYQVALAALVLLTAVADGRYLALSLHESGQLGPASIDPYLVVGGVVAGTALVLAIGWVLARYALHSIPVRGWLVLYAADILDRWQFRWTHAWNRVSPHSLDAMWPFALQAVAIAVDVALVLGLILAIRVIRLRTPVGGRDRQRRFNEKRLELHVLKASPLFAAVLPSSFASTASDLYEGATGVPLVDPLFSLVLFALAIPSVLLLERLSFDPEWTAATMKEQGVSVVGVPRGRPTEAFLRKRLWLLATIAAPWYGIALAAPQLFELLVPSAARVSLYGVQVALVTVIIYGAVFELRKPAGVALR